MAGIVILAFIVGVLAGIVSVRYGRSVTLHFYVPSNRTGPEDDGINESMDILIGDKIDLCDSGGFFMRIKTSYR